MAECRWFARLHWARPRQTLLHLPELRDPLLRDRERFDENGHVAQIARHRIHVFLIIDDELGHEAMLHLDAALGEIARVTKVLSTATAGEAVWVRTGTPHHRDNEIAFLYTSHGVPNLDNLTQRFVAEHEIFAASGRRAVF